MENINGPRRPKWRTKWPIWIYLNLEKIKNKNFDKQSSINLNIHLIARGQFKIIQLQFCLVILMIAIFKKVA